MKRMDFFSSLPPFLFFNTPTASCHCSLQKLFTADNLFDSDSRRLPSLLHFELLPPYFPPWVHRTFCLTAVRLSGSASTWIPSRLPLALSHSLLPPCHTCSAHPRCNCSEPGSHFYDYNRGQNAYAFRFPLAGCQKWKKWRGEEEKEEQIRAGVQKNYLSIVIRILILHMEAGQAWQGMPGERI